MIWVGELMTVTVGACGNSWPLIDMPTTMPVVWGNAVIEVLVFVVPAKR